MNSEEYQRWWMAYEPRSVDAENCPKCGCERFYNRGPAHQPFGLGIVVCVECKKMWTHVDKWLQCGLEEKELTIPDEYQHRLTDEPQYDSERDSEGSWIP